ncbi:MAG: peptide chain release factor N(5)-glutamine methyltransferase [Phycisphaerae bacterium]|nr:peptide chain release factor N(5)-glutamine methyltransferase [Phycisphaerae bacterium]
MSSAPHTADRQWTTRSLMAWMIDAFTRKDLDSPRVQAEMLLEHVLGCNRMKLYLDPDRPASPAERQMLRELVARALRHEPVQYLVGTAKFFMLDFMVDPRVLIPRPSTATIPEEVLQHVRATRSAAASDGEGLLIADICTGSGCLAVALLKNLPAARAVATDLSEPALAVAAANAQRHGVVDRLDLLRGDLLSPLLEFPATRGHESVDYLVSNPPYIPDHEWPDVAPNVKDYEPHLALRGGPDGLACVRPVLDHGPRWLRPGGLILVEVASCTADAAAGVLRSVPDVEDVRVLKDIDGLPRVVVGRKA